MALVKLSLPTFTGQGGATEVQHFLDLFESYCRTMTLGNNQMTIFSHCMKMNTKAAEWWSNITQSDTAHATWDETKALLQDRFNKKKNPGELAALVGTLQQRTNETVDDYRDRVDTFSREIAREIPDTWTDAERQIARRTLREVQAKIHFLVGLKPDLRKRVCAENITTLNEYQASARRAENALNDVKGHTMATGTKPIYVSAMESMEVPDASQEIVEATAYIDYLRAGGAPQRRFQQGQRGQRGAPQRRGGGGAQRDNPRRRVERGDKRPSWLSFVRLPPNTCYTCGQQGHLAADCKVPERNYRWDLVVAQLTRNPRVEEIKAETDSNHEQEEEDAEGFDCLTQELEKYSPSFQ